MPKISAKKRAPLGEETDVFFGRGGLANMLRRHSLYRELIEKNYLRYRANLTDPKSKRDFAKEIVFDEILRAGGKFYNEEDKSFTELDPENTTDRNLILTKIMQAFRDTGKNTDSKGKKNKRPQGKSAAIKERPKKLPKNLRTKKFKDDDSAYGSSTDNDDCSSTGYSSTTDDSTSKSNEEFKEFKKEDGDTKCHGDPQMHHEEKDFVSGRKTTDRSEDVAIATTYNNRPGCHSPFNQPEEASEGIVNGDSEGDNHAEGALSLPESPRREGRLGHNGASLEQQTFVSSESYERTMTRVNMRLNRLEGLVCFLMKENEAFRRNEAMPHHHASVAL